MRKTQKLKTHLFLVFISFFLSNCALQKWFITSSYKLEERHRLKRVALIMDDHQNIAKLDELFMSMARDYVSHKKEYIIYTLDNEVVDVQKTSLLKICRENSQIEGLLVHHWQRFDPKVHNIKLQMKSELIDCKNMKLVWTSTNGDTYKFQANELGALVRSWEGKLGSYVSDYVAPFYYFLDDLYFSLPDPILNDEDINEKVEKDAEV